MTKTVPAARQRWSMKDTTFRSTANKTTESSRLRRRSRTITSLVAILAVLQSQISNDAVFVRAFQPSSTVRLTIRVAASDRAFSRTSFPGPPSSVTCLQALNSVSDLPNLYQFFDNLNAQIDSDLAERLAGPFFGLSLIPYLIFLFFLNHETVQCPKGVVVGFATLLLFVFMSIPAAIAAKLLYGVSLADSDWLHGCAESLLTVTNLISVIAFRQAFSSMPGQQLSPRPVHPSVTGYSPMVQLTAWLVGAVALTAMAPILWSNPEVPAVHTPYLGGFLDLPSFILPTVWHDDPANALTVGCWIIHVSSLVEFLVVMGLVWRFGELTGQRSWQGLTWGLIPLHSSGIVACTYHLFYNQYSFLVPLQAALTCFGNSTAAYAAYRIAVSNGYQLPGSLQRLANQLMAASVEERSLVAQTSNEGGQDDFNPPSDSETSDSVREMSLAWTAADSRSLVGFEDLGDALQADSDFSFLIKLFVGCAIFSYAIKYGELAFDFPFDPHNSATALAFILLPTMLNTYKWYQRSKDPTFEGWF
jgi:Protein of unknown function (DUF2499)/Protein of unknown function (DUF3593)